MNHKEEAVTADICLLLEGTWPYVRGGVSSWIHQMILGLPDLTFSVMFIGGQRSAYSARRYEVPSNVVHIEEVFLEDATHPAHLSGVPRKADQQQHEDLYRFLHHPDAPAPQLGERILERIAQGHMTLDDVLGAFLIGAIMAESRQLLKIERLIEPVRDLFSAIFFVAIGLMLDPAILLEYASAPVR